MGAAILMAPLPAMAQETTGPLDLPNDVQLLAPPDPAIRKATAIVNGTIITETDIDQRLALVLVANQGKVSDEERQRLRLQVLSNLIDETLEIDEAKANKITIDKSEIDNSYARVGQQFKMTPDKFSDYVRSVGSSPASLKRQIEGESAWRRVLSREVEPFVSISDEEVTQVIKRLEAAKGQPEYHVGEIYLSATPVTQAQVEANANRIVEQVRQGASFVAYARQYSEASTAAVGGDLGWVRAQQLPDALANVLPQMQSGTVSAPIPISGGFSIIALIDKRQVLMADPRDAVLSLKQLTITFPANVSREQAQPKVTAFSDGLKTLQGCGKVAEFAKAMNAEVIDNDAVKVRDLPAPLQPIMLNLRVGESSPPFGSSTDGVHALVVCGRDDPETASIPTFEQIQTQMSDERVNMRARRYLRDLRRDAIIDYR
ncbi:peptidylprolyl isomerase [Sphingomonas nostoxanthinifaciens]|uniref:peptidylprolyl isomerase n=1 Tax=Sphingomonas nostoxanthinifaciens TaxID=2872652 RepID=UPI001CC1F58E|nr:peptidylprolyl isomerase [Sphingomonas nostoxanthinifaciens]